MKSNVLDEIINIDLKELCLINQYSLKELEIIRDYQVQYPYVKMHQQYYDIAGQKFGRLKVLYYIGNRKYLCLCDCGNISIHRKDGLTSGSAQSCGCYKLECCHQRKKENQYDLTGEYGRGWTYNTNREFYFDLEDFDKIKSHSWKENPNGYIVSKRAKEIMMHRLVMEIDDPKIVVDHKEHNNWDNRKEKLRLVTTHQNTMNEKLAINNTSGVTGVSFEKGKWRAYIWYNGKTIHLGNYSDINNAISARIQGEEKYFGKYGYHQSMKESYDENKCVG